MAIYDVLAGHYDAVTGDSVTEAVLVRDILERRYRRARTVLDVACGTGAITAPLACSYQVSGLDIAPAMLAVARQKLPAGTPLYLADMTSFELSARYDAIVCAYQGANHLLSFTAWTSFFGCVCRHLSPGGVFVFDIATVGYLTAMASTARIVQEWDGNYLLVKVHSTGAASFEWQIEVFELQPGGRYRLITQAVGMASFPVARIQAALRRWFTGVEVTGGDGSAVSPGTGDRVWFSCVRPS
jgi:SAM-dependent methyltransferase